MAPPQGTGTGFYAERMDEEIIANVEAGEEVAYRMNILLIREAQRFYLTFQALNKTFGISLITSFD